MQAQIGSRLNGNRLIDPTMDKADQEAGKSDFDIANGANSLSIASMRTRLKAVNAGLYTDAYLDTLNANDLLFAVRTDGVV